MARVEIGGVETLLARRLPVCSIDVLRSLSNPSDFAESSPWFVDMVTGLPGSYCTQVRSFFDEDVLAFVFNCEDPFPTASIAMRNDIVFRDNDVEVFIDFGSGYYEVEINALNTVYQVLHVWRDSLAGWNGRRLVDLDIANASVFTFAGDYDRQPESFWHGTHPRGARVSWLGFDLARLETNVDVEGVLNDFSEVSLGWTASVVLPWDSLSAIAGQDVRAMAESATGLRVLLARFQHFFIGGARQTAAWCVTPHGLLDSHLPEKFTRLLLADEPRLST